MLLRLTAVSTARHPGRKFTGHERSRGWYLVSVQPTSFYLFSGKLEYLNKIIRFNTSIVSMKMNPCEEIRRRQMPETFQEEMKWFAKGFHQPKTRREISSATIDAFQAMIWDKPFGDLIFYQHTVANPVASLMFCPFDSCFKNPIHIFVPTVNFLCMRKTSQGLQKLQD